MAGALNSITSWDPSKHPRGKAGSGSGGRFAPLSYNAKTNKGTGYGSKHGDTRVKAAQQALNKAHMTDAQGRPLVLDGKLGPKTTAAIKAYQKAHKLRVDGKLTTTLLAYIKAGGKRTGTHKKAHLAKKPAAPKRSTRSVAATPKPY